MATPQEKLANSLEVLRELQEDRNNIAIKSSEISRIHRQRLFENGFLKKVLDGWYIAVPPNEQEGDSTSWFASYWQFCARYLKERFGSDYCLSAEQSLQIHAGNWTVPQQLIVRTTKGTNKATPLPFHTSLFSMQSNLPDDAQITDIHDLRLLNLPTALIHCSPTTFAKNATDVRAAMAQIRDASELLSQLLDGGHTTIAGRLAGAFRNIGKDRIADDILKSMKAAGYDVRENDPFKTPPPINLSNRIFSPYVNRIQLMWHEMRQVVIAHFPGPPGLSDNKEAYLMQMEDLFVTDAYHSLSIEKYRVTPDLIRRVKSGDWNPENIEADRQQRDAMAARGYWQASQAVKASIAKVFDGKDAGEVADIDHSDWYRELFAPSVTAGFLKPSDLAGYRNDQDYIGQSKHVPMHHEGVRDAMPEFFELLKQEENAAARVVLGHFFFVFIHPYMDGNGRMGRFLMNVMLAAGGYPWTVIPVEERQAYMDALEKASVESNIKPFTQFLAWLVEEGMKGNPVASI